MSEIIELIESITGFTKLLKDIYGRRSNNGVGSASFHLELDVGEYIARTDLGVYIKSTNAAAVFTLKGRNYPTDEWKSVVTITLVATTFDATYTNTYRYLELTSASSGTHEGEMMQ